MTASAMEVASTGAAEYGVGAVALMLLGYSAYNDSVAVLLRPPPKVAVAPGAPPSAPPTIMQRYRPLAMSVFHFTVNGAAIAVASRLLGASWKRSAQIGAGGSAAIAAGLIGMEYARHSST